MQEEDEVYDTIIIGAGPCGLATAARLREPTPAALFTDEEHRRFHWLNKHGKKVSLKHVRSGKTSSGHPPARREAKLLVLDATDDKWLGRWNRLFSTYDISHLRSPMMWHVDPLDRDSLLAHAWKGGREDELVEIRNCVGREVSKHARKKGRERHCGGKQDARVAINLRERNDYYTPSQSLFCDHCQDIADRYRLGPGLLRKEQVEDIDFDVVRGVSVADEQLFTISTCQTRRYARSVVLAVGPANVPKIPHFPSMPTDTTLPQACHSMEIQQFPDPILQQKIAASSTTNVLIIGGGLTSAQLTDFALRRGVSRVWHLMRGPLRIKPFDVDLQWMGKYKNTEQARFWLADSDEERLDMLREARGGGSVTPLFGARLRSWVAKGRVILRTETKVVDAEFTGENGNGTWKVKTEPPVEGMPLFDFIYFATGIQTDFAALPYLQSMLRKYPIPGHGGFPCLNDDLMWKDDVPLFMAGRLAALRLGPAAPNIGGAKIGAERIAWAIEDVLGGSEEGSLGEDDDGDGRLAGYLSGHGNMYRTLAVER